MEFHDEFEIQGDWKVSSLDWDQWEPSDSVQVDHSFNNDMNEDQLDRFIDGANRSKIQNMNFVAKNATITAPTVAVNTLSAASVKPIDSKLDNDTIDPENDANDSNFTALNNRNADDLSDQQRSSSQAHSFIINSQHSSNASGVNVYNLNSFISSALLAIPLYTSSLTQSIQISKMYCLEVVKTSHHHLNVYLQKYPPLKTFLYSTAGLSLLPVGIFSLCVGVSFLASIFTAVMGVIMVQSGVILVGLSVLVPIEAGVIFVAGSLTIATSITGCDQLWLNQSSKQPQLIDNQKDNRRLTRDQSDAFLHSLSSHHDENTTII